MTAKAARRRAHKEARRVQAQQPKAPREQPTLTVVSSNTKLREKTGLEWMSGKQRINTRQLEAGMRYGKAYRLSEVDGMEPLRSCLDDTPGGSSAGGRLLMPRYAIEADARMQLAEARAALSFHAGMIAACDLICGRGLTPWEVIGQNGGGRGDVEKVQNTLVIALDLLATHYR